MTSLLLYYYVAASTGTHNLSNPHWESGPLSVVELYCAGACNKTLLKWQITIIQKHIPIHVACHVNILLLLSDAITLVMCLPYTIPAGGAFVW